MAGKKNVIKIHGKDYMTVAGRVELVHADKEAVIESITTEVLPVPNMVVVKATVRLYRKVVEKDAHVSLQIQTFTGISAANPEKSIEKQSPFEVAETSAVGRALGFAGYGIVEGIATADEMKKADAHIENGVDSWAPDKKEDKAPKQDNDRINEWQKNKLRDQMKQQGITEAQFLTDNNISKLEDLSRADAGDLITKGLFWKGGDKS